ncbi:alpha/beta hydrolase [Aestuariivivens insulae]|uniref:alpha/beta hydrolase n=1 Tax=Aestuariivivens insulae TaxID=1621988 RepID=UPI001F5A30D0|nr:alpha/beta fold hydrolase [Aestuariivivens insulae]
MKKLRSLKLAFLLVFLSSTIASAQEPYADFSYFPKIEFNDKIVGSQTEDNGTTFEKIVIDGFDSKIPFYFISPKNRIEDKFVILLHGMSESKNLWVNPRINSKNKKFVKLKDSLLTLGYSLIIPDAKYHGERSYEANFASPVTFIPSKDYQKLFNLYTTTVKDIRILMDYIQYRLKTSSITFNVVGYSMGGMMTLFLNSVDDRLKHVVVCAAPLDGKKGAKLSGMSEEDSKKVVLSPMDFATFQKAPVTLLMGTKDWWYTKEEAQDFFDNISVKDKSLKFYESGHFLPDEFILDVIEALNKP